MTGTTFPARGRLQAAKRAPRLSSQLKAHQTPLLVVLAVMTVMNISRSHYMIPWLLALHPGQVLFALAVLFALLRPRHLDMRNMTRSWPAKTLFAFGTLAALSAVFGLSVGQSATYILNEYSRTLVYAVLLVVGIRSARDMHTIVWATFIGCAIIAYTAIFVFQLESHDSNLVARLNDFYEWDSNDIGCVMTIGLPLSMLLFRHSSRAWKPAVLLVVVGIMVTIARAGSRGTFVALVVMGVMMLVLVRGVSVARRGLMVAAAAIALFISAPPGYWAQMATIGSEQDYNYSALEGRKALALRGLGYMMRYPVFGIGISNFSRAECEIPDAARIAAGNSPHCMAPHNSLVQMGSELGVPGAILWIAVIVGGCVGLLRLRRRIPAAWARGTPEERYLSSVTTFLPVAVAGFGVSSFFVTFAFLSPVYILIAPTAATYVEIDKRLPARARA